MIAIWRFSERRLANLIVIVCLLNGNLDLCWSLNDEGLALLRFRQSVVSDPFGALSNWNDDIGVMDPCSWYGVECSDGNILVLILRNNSFYGIIPEVIGELKDLKLLDLGYNNFSGTLPSDLGNNLSLTILLLDNNELLGGISPKTHELKIISEIEVDESQLSNSAQRPSSGERSISWNNIRTGGAAYRRLLEDPGADLRVIRHKSSAVHAPLTSPSSSPSPSPTSNSPSSSPSPSPSPAPSTVPSPDLNSVPPNASRPSLSVPIPSPAESRSIPAASSNSKHHRAIMFSVAIGGPVLLFALAIGILFSQGNKAIAARPWATGLSGQLQKALVTAKLFLPHKNKPILCLILLLCS